MRESRPDLTVVVALISGALEHLRTCLGALHHQVEPPSMEILVPYDETVAGVLALSSQFPQVRFILAEALNASDARSGASREHHDALRTIHHARGQTVSMIDDHSTPTDGWCRGLLTALEHHSKASQSGGRGRSHGLRQRPTS